MKRKSFIMQGICLFMLLFGMHLCVYSTFLEAGNLYKFALALAVASMWFSALAAAPCRRLEHKIKTKWRIPYLKYPAADLLLLITVTVWVILTFCSMEHIQKDLKVLTDAVSARQNRYLYNIDISFNPYSVVYQGARGTWLLLDLEMLAGLFMSRVFVHRHGMFWGTLPPALLVAAGLLLGKAPTIPAMILLIAGIMGMQMILDEYHVGGSKHFRQISVARVRHWLFYPVMLACILGIFGVGARVSVMTQDKALQGEDKLLRLQHSMENQIVDFGTRTVQKIQEILNIEQPGVMTNTSPKFTGETVMTITVDHKPQTDLYMRGFIGTKYENGKWSSASKEKLNGLLNSEICYQLFTQDYNIYQASEVAVEKGTDVYALLKDGVDLGNQNAMNMKIKYARDNRSTFAYFPYYSKLSDDSMGTLMLDHDRGFRRGDDVKSYDVTIQKTDSESCNQLKNIDLLQRGYEPYYVQTGSRKKTAIVYEVGNSSYLTKEVDLAALEEAGTGQDGVCYVEVSNKNLGKYYQYVMDVDLQLPEKGLEKTKKLARKLVNNEQIQLLKVQNTYDSNGAAQVSSANRIINDLRLYLGNTTAYSQKLKMKEIGQDYVENFLFAQKSGYCEHYATAGAVLLRAMGVPSRYVSGYRVPASHFVRNDDGTYTAKVIDKEAHAWTEVYSLSAGWVVADMTPGSADDQNMDQSTAENSSSDQKQETASTEKPDFGDDEFLENDPESNEKAAHDTEETEPPKEKATKEPKSTADAAGDSYDEDAGSDVTSDTADGAAKEAAPDSNKWKKLIAGGAAVAAVILIIWMIWYSQRLRRQRRLKKCTGGAYLLEMNRQLEQLLSCCGYGKPQHMTDQEYIRLLEKIYPKGTQDEKISTYYHQLEKARFDKRSITKEEISECGRLIRGVRRAALASAGFKRKIYAVLIKAWKV